MALLTILLPIKGALLIVIIYIIVQCIQQGGGSYASVIPLLIQYILFIYRIAKRNHGSIYLRLFVILEVVC